MSKNKREWIPPWNMPADPVKAVWWFLHWLLKVLVNFFWVAIIVMVIYETYLNWSVAGVWNGIVAGVVTLLVGLVVWALLRGLLFAVNLGTGISQVVADISNLQKQSRQSPYERPDTFFADKEKRDDPQEHIVEGTITDLEEERQKRRHE